MAKIEILTTEGSKRNYEAYYLEDQQALADFRDYIDSLKAFAEECADSGQIEWDEEKSRAVSQALNTVTNDFESLSGILEKQELQNLADSMLEFGAELVTKADTLRKMLEE